MFRLCGGTFFALLCEIRKPLPSKREGYSGSKSGRTDTDILIGLARIVNPNIQVRSIDHSSLQDNTTNFKSCKNWGGTIFDFGQETVRRSFDEKIRGSYPSLLKDMATLLEDVLDYGPNTKNGEYLIKELVDIIEKDTYIPDTAMFHICPDGRAMTKCEIIVATSFVFESFLLGIWNYVLQLDDNKFGAETFDTYWPHNNRRKRVYAKKLGAESKRMLTLQYYDDFIKQWQQTNESNETTGVTEESLTIRENGLKPEPKQTASELALESPEPKLTITTHTSKLEVQMGGSELLIESAAHEETTRSAWLDFERQATMPNSTNQPGVPKYVIYGGSPNILENGTQNNFHGTVNNYNGPVYNYGPKQVTNRPRWYPDRVDREYYNLFVANQIEPLNHGQFRFSLTRESCLSDFMDEKIIKSFGTIESNLSWVKTMPSLLMEPNSCNHAMLMQQSVQCGFVSDIIVNEKFVQFEFSSWGNGLQQSSISEICERLGIRALPSFSELFIPHWAIKHTDLIQRLSESGLNFPSCSC